MVTGLLAQSAKSHNIVKNNQSNHPARTKQYQRHTNIDENNEP